MVYKCCVTGCHGNFDSECKVKIFRLSHQKHSEAVPRGNIADTPYTSICEDH